MLAGPATQSGFRSIGMHPYALWREAPYGGHTLLQCLCRFPGCSDPEWSHVCVHGPERRARWLQHFAIQHAHGLRPVVSR